MTFASVVLGVVIIVEETAALGFHVQPSRISFEIAPGKTAATMVHIRNLQQGEEGSLVIELLDVKQGDNGKISLIADAEDGTFSAGARSCRSWIRIEEKDFRIPPGSAKELEILFDIPPMATGDYFGLIGIRSVPKDDQKMVSLAVRLVVVVEISVTGRTPARRVELTGVNIGSLASTDDLPARDIVTVSVINSGEVASRLAGTVTVFELLGDKTRRVASIPVSSTRAIPGSSFNLVLEAPRRLPTGRYRVIAEIRVDEQRLPTFSRDIDFIGDPSVTSVEPDGIVVLEPGLIEVIGVPGSKRKRFVLVKNDGTEPVTITMRLNTVESLKAVVMGSVKGTQLDCAGWVSLNPAEFELSPGMTKRVAVDCEFPGVGSLRPCSYATVNLEATFMDGPLATRTSALVVARNAKAQPKVQIELSKASLAIGEGDEYSVNIEYVNTGEKELHITWGARVQDMARNRSYYDVVFAENEEPLLPLETSAAHGRLLTDSIEPGEYVLALHGSYEKEKFGKEFFLRIFELDGRRVAELTR